MKIRTKLATAFLLLSVLPLSAVVAYSYFTNIRAFREVVQSDAASLTGEMEIRLASAKEEVRDRIASIGDLSVPSMEGRATDHSRMVDKLAASLGNTAQIVKSLQFIPSTDNAAERVPGGADPVSVTTPLGALTVFPPGNDAPPSSLAVPSRVGNWALAFQPPTPGSLAKAIPDKDARTRAKQGLNAATLALGIASKFVEQSADDDAPEGQSTRIALVKGALELGRQIAVAEKEALEAADDGPIIGSPIACPARANGRLIGELRAQLKGRELIHRVLTEGRRQGGEIPFAIDKDSRLYTATEEEKEALEPLQLTNGDETHSSSEDWVVVTASDSESGLAFGIAKPISASIAKIRNTAIKNLGVGLASILFALLGLFPLSSRLTRNLDALSAAAHRIAEGKLNEKVCIKSNDETGQLADSFNTMADDLRKQREQLAKEERLRRDQAVRQELLARENERRGAELAEARAFQLSLLPKRLPDHEGFEAAVFVRTATEVGGDFYDFSEGADGSLTVVIGDATGHGARAGTMVAVVKSLFTASGGTDSPIEFLKKAAEIITKMDLRRMSMALAVARFHQGTMTLVSAGMPPLLIRRSEGTLDEISLPGMPLGGIPDFPYGEMRVPIAAGDTVLLMSDGFPELIGASGEVMGYERLHDLVSENGALSPAELLARLETTLGRFKGGAAPDDDVTFLALRARNSA